MAERMVVMTAAGSSALTTAVPDTIMLAPALTGRIVQHVQKESPELNLEGKKSVAASK